jgi:aflatoxin B1 aldehyde reductase
VPFITEMQAEESATESNFPLERSEIFGLSNFAAWEVCIKSVAQDQFICRSLAYSSALAKVAEVVGICKSKGYVLPGIYQAMYNGITRAIEPELVPCLRKNKIRLVIYNPLAGMFSSLHSSNKSIDMR